MIDLVLQTDSINLEKSLTKLGAKSDGAVVTFIGQARNNSKGKKVLYLEYQVYESMAKKELKKVLEEAKQKWPITNCLTIHRYGKVKIGETSIFIAVSAPHRLEAFEANKYIIDEIKKRVPIWKKEYYSDGTAWITDRS